MITVNKSSTTITGVYGANKQFSLPYEEKLYKSILELADAADNAAKVDELNKIYEELEKLVTQDINIYLETKVKNVYKHTDGRYYMQTGKVISSVAMPESLVDRLEKTIDEGLDATPLIKFWTRFLRNPKLRKLDKAGQEAFSNKVFNYVNLQFVNEEVVEKLIEEKGYTAEVAEAMATVPQVQITKEGLLKTFKVSKEITQRFKLNDKGEKESYDVYSTGKKTIDEITGLITYEKVELTNEDRVFQPAVQRDGGDAFMCSITGKLGHIIKVGGVHTITWEQINCNDNTSCVSGMHCGGLTYIKGYQSDGTETHNILVDPMNIGAVPCDTNGAIRVVEYYVLDAFSGVNGSLYHSSAYGQMTDKVWEDMRAEAIKHFGTLQAEKSAKIKKESDEISAI